MPEGLRKKMKRSAKRPARKGARPEAARVGLEAAESVVLTRALEKRIEETRMMREGQRVGVAVSGGADSVALLLLLVERRRKLGLTLTALHFNHRLRGRAADADEKFVVKLCGELKVQVYVGAADVGAMAKRDRANVEDAARRARYLFFAEAAEKHRLDKIAVAHTADDQAETVLAHILRGSGLKGLGGIHPRVGKIVRPLLAVSRAELRTYLKARKQSWREDATNRDTSKTRARIRKKLIPLLGKDFQPRVVEHLGTLAMHAREDEALLDRVTEKYLADRVEKDAGSARIKIADLLGDISQATDASNALSSRVVRLVIRRLKAEREARRGLKLLRGGEITSMHVGQIVELARSGRSGLSLSMPGEVRVRRVHDALIFDVTEKSRAAPRAHFEYKIDSLAGSPRVQVPELGCAFRFTVIDWCSKRGETSISGEVLNGDRLSFPLTLRDWHHGDRFHARGHTKPQKLKRLFGEEGIDRWQREGWPVLVSSGVLAWVRQFGPSAEFAVGAETRVGIVITEEQSE